jgi:hypothetical protein
MALMEKSKFADAFESLDIFERDHDFILKAYAKIVQKLAGEVSALRAEVTQTRDAQFQKDLASLKTAVEKNDATGGSEILERVLEYGTEPMKAEARTVWDKTGGVYEKARAQELARLEAGEARVQAPDKAPSPLAPKAGPAEPAPEDIAPDPEPAKEAPKDNADDFFGPSKGSDDLKLFTQVTLNKDGTLTVTANKSKATLAFTGNADIFLDTAIDAKKYAEHLVPNLPVLTYGEAKTIRLDNDPTNGRRLVSISFMLMGDGVPDKYSYQDPSPKKKLCTWHKGVFSRRTPQLIFRLANIDYLAQGEPDIAIKRKKIAQGDLPRSTFAVYVAGNAEGLGRQTPGKLTVRTLIVLPASAAANAAIYRALLQE